MAKSWKEKFFSIKNFEIKTIQKNFWGHVAGSKMLIPTPLIIQEYINHIESGKISEVKIMRNDLAIEYQADKTCPVTTGIFLRIVSEASFEELNEGKDIQKVTPFWRIVNPKSKLAEKLECGIDFIEKQRENEGIEK